MSEMSPLYLIVFDGMIIRSFDYTVEKDEFLELSHLNDQKGLAVYQKIKG